MELTAAAETICDAIKVSEANGVALIGGEIGSCLIRDGIVLDEQGGEIGPLSVVLENVADAKFLLLAPENQLITGDTADRDRVSSSSSSRGGPRYGRQAREKYQSDEECHAFKRNGRCRFGDRCRFTHF